MNKDAAEYPNRRAYVRQYAKPAAVFVKLSPEERLMSRSKATPEEEACQDPMGNADLAS